MKVREPEFDFENSQIGTDWYRGDKYVTALIDTMSIIIPAGEGYLLRTAKRALPYVVDPKLHHDLTLFIEQEALHSYHHIRYNEVLLKRRPWMQKVADLVPKMLGEDVNLERDVCQITVGEHLTAICGYSLLKQSYVNLPPVIREFWCWHGVEELEHRTLCWDLYNHLGYSKWKFRFNATLDLIKLVSILTILTQYSLMISGRGKWWEFPMIPLRAFNPKTGSVCRLIFDLFKLVMPNYDPIYYGKELDLDGELKKHNVSYKVTK